MMSASCLEKATDSGATSSLVGHSTEATTSAPGVFATGFASSGTRSRPWLCTSITQIGSKRS